MPEYSYLIGSIIAVLFAGIIGLIANNVRDSHKSEE